MQNKENLVQLNRNKKNRKKEKSLQVGDHAIQCRFFNLPAAKIGRLLVTLRTIVKLLVLGNTKMP